jgi:hypothetical protein
MEIVKVYSAAGQLEAEMIKAFLEAQGIEVVLNQESVGRTYGFSAGKLGLVDVLVPESQNQAAKDLLNDMNQGKFEQIENSDTLDNEISQNNVDDCS